MSGIGIRDSVVGHIHFFPLEFGPLFSVWIIGSVRYGCDAVERLLLPPTYVFFTCSYFDMYLCSLVEKVFVGEWVRFFFLYRFFFCFCILCPFIYLCVCLYVSSRCVGVFFCTFACVCMSVCANANHISMWIFIVPLRYLKRERIHVRTPYQRKRRNILDSVERNAI